MRPPVMFSLRARSSSVRRRGAKMVPALRSKSGVSTHTGHLQRARARHERTDIGGGRCSIVAKAPRTKSGKRAAAETPGQGHV